MAQRKGRRRFSLRKVRVASSVLIGALAASDVVAGVATGVATNTLRVTSLKAAYNLNDLGAAIDDGQEFGIAHSDYSAAEIEECLEASESMDIGDKIAQERANRLVRSLGRFVGTQLADGSLTFNDGRPVKVKLNWLLAIGDSIQLWLRNGSDTVYTTGAAISLIGEMWVTP